MINNKTTITIAFIFNERGKSLSDVTVIRPGRCNKGRDYLIDELTSLNINKGNDDRSKFRIVNLDLDSVIDRTEIDKNLKSIEKYYINRYSKKKYDSPKRWFNSIHVRNLLNEELGKFKSFLEIENRTSSINSILDN